MRLAASRPTLGSPGRRWGGVISHNNVVAHTGEGGCKLLENRHDRVVDEDDAVLGVVDDVGELLGEQADVERVQHRTDARHRHVQLEVALVVPRERANAIALSHAQPLQHAREAIDALAHLPVAGAHDAGLGERDDLRPRDAR